MEEQAAISDIFKSGLGHIKNINNNVCLQPGALSRFFEARPPTRCEVLKKMRLKKALLAQLPIASELLRVHVAKQQGGKIMW